jgi:hypothetical protein
MTRIRPMAKRSEPLRRRQSAHRKLRTALKSFRMTPSLIARAKKAARKERLSLSRWIEMALERELSGCHQPGGAKRNVMLAPRATEGTGRTEQAGEL